MRVSMGGGDHLPSGGLMLVGPSIVLQKSVSGNNFQAHSLSWSRTGERPPGATLQAKIWMPEDPRNFANSGNGFGKDELR
ncbi:hypothetical protein EVAR_71545_1 [Eumeta japonica]|uniref:Uncharacterized protein n=1 Tax=Eumeta variegata TaxID=151549 RepID=A0A4C1SVP6_EUMVA|nr:hypothetical protein EVAR_71545_1 [Eumeta japonica]